MSEAYFLPNYFYLRKKGKALHTIHTYFIFTYILPNTNINLRNMDNKTLMERKVGIENRKNQRGTRGKSNSLSTKLVGRGSKNMIKDWSNRRFFNLIHTMHTSNTIDVFGAQRHWSLNSFVGTKLNGEETNGTSTTRIWLEGVFSEEISVEVFPCSSAASNN